jgi:hypothetical protein
VFFNALALACTINGDSFASTGDKEFSGLSMGDSLSYNGRYTGKIKEWYGKDYSRR